MDREESTTGFLVAHTQIEFLFYMKIKIKGI